MGVFPSKQGSLSEKEQRALKRERLLRAQGIFVPPVFAVGLDDESWGDSPSRAQSLYYDVATTTTTTTTTFPNSLSEVGLAQQRDPSLRILQDYMTPGLWFQSVSGEATVLASLSVNDKMDDDAQKWASWKHGGKVLVGRSVGDDENVNIRLQGGTQGGLPRWTGTVRLNDAVTLGITADAQGRRGGFSGSWKAQIGNGDTRNGIQLKGTSFMPWDLQKSKFLGKHMYLTASMASSDANRWKIAADTNVNLNDLRTQDTRLFGNINLQEAETGAERPFSPVHLSLELNQNASAVALTQRIAFDRVHFNLIDDRVPLVRNTVGWTLRMEQPMSLTPNNKIQDDNTNSKNAPTSPKVTLGAVWQLNRAMAVKATLQDDQSVTAALICKRWKHPRVTCSILRRYHVPSYTGAWLGVSFEVETGRLAEDGESSSTPLANGGGGAPPTKVQLPPGVSFEDK